MVFLKIKANGTLMRMSYIRHTGLPSSHHFILPLLFGPGVANRNKTKQQHNNNNNNNNNDPSNTGSCLQKGTERQPSLGSSQEDHSDT